MSAPRDAGRPPLSHSVTPTPEWEREASRRAQHHIWYPFTPMLEWEREVPIVIASGRGATLTDIHGKEYLDAVSSLWVNLHGHRHPAMDRALRKQIATVAHTTLLGASHPTAITLARRLIEIVPAGLTRVFYSDNGSTAVEVALKMAFDFWRHQGQPRRKRFISFTSAYHGDTLGAVSLGGIDRFHDAYRPLLFKPIRVPAPTCYRCPIGLTYPSCEMACLGEVEAVMKRRRHDVAALVIEPTIQAAAGMLTAPPGYLKRIRALCDRYDILLIADEVATGFGRTGTMFACEQDGVTPDLMALAKGLTGGYLPLAATLATDRVYAAFLGEYADGKTFHHGHSYTGNPLGCAAALANLDLFKSERVIENIQPKIGLLRRLLAPWRRWRHVGDIRQIGLMIGIELVADQRNKTPYPPALRVGRQVCLEAATRGILLRPLGNVIVLMPPLCISADEIERMVKVVGTCVQQVTRRLARRPPPPNASRAKSVIPPNLPFE